MKRGPYVPPRAELRLTDLKRRTPTAMRLMTVKLPATLVAELSRLCRRLGATQTDVVTALLNEGLEAVGKRAGRKLV